MPRVSAFYGITIWVYWRDHQPPHFHAEYGEHWAELTIAGRRVIRGELPPRALRLVREWGKLRQAELIDDWRRAEERRPLIPIDPLP